MDHRTHVIVSCRDCGQTRMPADEVTLRGCLDDDQWSYRFTCPGCGLASVESTSVSRALDAVENGLSVETWHYPSELDEPHEGPALNLDDRLAPHRNLVAPDWLYARVAAG